MPIDTRKTSPDGDLRETACADESPERELRPLLDAAIGFGATGARAINADQIVVEEPLAAMCVEPGCPNYGLSASCPPHVSGPSGFREISKKFQTAIVITFDVPTSTLLSDDRLELFRLLHESVAAVEQEALTLGYEAARAFAGGSCKAIFCSNEIMCNVVQGDGICRHPEVARHSMSGYGVNVQRLMESAGWAMTKVTSQTDPELEPTSPLVGLVLVGGK